VIKWLGLNGPAVMILAGGLFMAIFPITRKRHNLILAALDGRQQRRARMAEVETVPMPGIPGLPSGATA
jgi:Na+/melibiose symporter-like transporter